MGRARERLHREPRGLHQESQARGTSSARARAHESTSPASVSAPSPSTNDATRALARALARRKVLGYTADENGIIIDDSIAVAASKRAAAARRAGGQKRSLETGGELPPPPNYDPELQPMFGVPALAMAGTTLMADIPLPAWYCRADIANPGDPLCAVSATRGHERGEAG